MKNNVVRVDLIKEVLEICDTCYKRYFSKNIYTRSMLRLRRSARPLQILCKQISLSVTLVPGGLTMSSSDDDQEETHYNVISDNTCRNNAYENSTNSVEPLIRNDAILVITDQSEAPSTNDKEIFIKNISDKEKQPQQRQQKKKERLTTKLRQIRYLSFTTKGKEIQSKDQCRQSYNKQRAAQQASFLPSISTTDSPFESKTSPKYHLENTLLHLLSE